MKANAILFLAVFAISLTLFSCKNDNEKIVGKWQHILIVGYSFRGSDTLDMTKYPPTFNTFREDNTLLVTNGKEEVNVRYFVRDKKLFSFILGAPDTSIMEIKKLTKDELILQVSINDGTQRKENLHYKRVD